MSFYKIALGFVAIIMKICFRVEYIGKENIPEENGYIYCANHICMLDPILIACTSKTEFHFIAKEELMRIPVLGTILKHVNVIPVKRGTGDIGAMKKGIEVLNEKKNLIIFPEGTRSKTGKMGEAKNGMALLVKKTGCGIVPCAVIGKPHFFKRTKFVYGKPIPPGYFEGEKSLDVITEYAVSQIKNMLEKNN